ncbi:MAG: hypothetical protein ACTSP3_09905 [Candidatus Heimdallarchaeaceae archaeon]
MTKMSLWTYVGIGVAGGIVLVVLILFLILLKRRREENPIINRAKNMQIMLTQRVHTLHNRIKKLDDEITKLTITQQEGESALIGDENLTQEEIQLKISSNQSEIKTLIADIQDLEEYNKKIHEKVKQKKEGWEAETEELLEFIKNKLKYRFT